MGKTVLITGATSGFGEACAYKFAENGYRLILNGRRKDRLQNLQLELEKFYETACYLLPFDVRNQQEVFSGIESLPDEWKDIDILINNAGLALGRDLFQDASIDDWNTMLDTNVKGLLYVSKAVIPLLIKKGKGHVINVGSIAGVEVYEKGNVYCASKHAVDAISKAMRIDLLQHHIKVTVVHPGAAETEFSLVRFKGNEENAKKVYEGYTPLSAKDVADVIYYAASLPEHVCINELQLSCTQQANSYHLVKEQ
jgi:3-hydroxy acid dehydrogenase / malonic semialdehyde reductase